MSTEGPPDEVNANDVVAFVVEIGVFVLLAVAGWQAGTSPPTSWVLAIILPLVAAVLWGLFAAPRARVESRALRLTTKLLVLGAGVVAGFLVLPPLWAVVWALVVITDTVLMYVGPLARRPVS